LFKHRNQFTGGVRTSIFINRYQTHIINKLTNIRPVKLFKIRFT
jgi:hypothetical protein